GRYGASGVVLGGARILIRAAHRHRATLRFAPSLRPSQPPRLAPSRESRPAATRRSELRPPQPTGRLRAPVRGPGSAILPRPAGQLGPCRNLFPDCGVISSIGGMAVDVLAARPNGAGLTWFRSR